MLALSIRQPYAEVIPSSTQDRLCGGKGNQDGGATVDAEDDFGGRFYIYACNAKAKKAGGVSKLGCHGPHRRA
jgi:hypothetical protein